MSLNVLRPTARPLWFLLVSIALIMTGSPVVCAADYYRSRSLGKHLMSLAEQNPELVRIESLARSIGRRNVWLIDDDHDGLIDEDGPEDIDGDGLIITDGKVHDVNILDELVLEPGSFYIMDRGYIDFARLYTFTQNFSFFVTTRVLQNRD